MISLIFSFYLSIVLRPQTTHAPIAKHTITVRILRSVSLKWYYYLLYILNYQWNSRVMALRQTKWKAASFWYTCDSAYILHSPVVHRCASKWTSIGKGWPLIEKRIKRKKRKKNVHINWIRFQIRENRYSDNVIISTLWRKQNHNFRVEWFGRLFVVVVVVFMRTFHFVICCDGNRRERRAK